MTSPDILYGLAATFAWGVGDFFTAVFVRKVNVFKVLFWSILSGFVLMLVCFFLLGAHFSIPRPSSLAVFLFIGLMQILGTLFFYKGFEVGKVSLVSPLAAICSLWTILISLTVFRERLEVVQGAGIVLVVAGTFLVSTKLNILISEARFIASDPGVRFALLASIFWGMMFAFLAPLTRKYGWLEASVVLRACAVFWLILLRLFSKKDLSFPVSRTVVLLLAVVVVTDVAGYLFNGLAFEKGLASIVAPVASAFPAITILLARIFLKEKLALNQIFGIVGIIGGLVLLSI